MNREQLETALRNAHKAGDVAAAKKLAQALSQTGGAQNPPTMAGTFEGSGGQGPIVEPQVFDSGAKSARIGTSIKAAFIDDPQAKIALYARERFPDDPQAVNRYRVVDGQIAYQGSDGNMYLEEGGTINPVASGVARAALPAVGGMIGTVVGPLGAGIGAAAGEGYNRLIGNYLGDNQTPMGNAGAMALEGALGYGGAKIGSGIASAAEARTARDINRYNPAVAQGLQDTASRMGIPLEAAQLTNLPSLRARSHYLRMRAGESADVFDRFDRTQDDAVTRAVMDFFDDVSPVADAAQAATMTQQAATDAIGRAGRVATRRASPVYRQAMNEAQPVDVTPVLAKVDDLLATVKDPKVRASLRQIRKGLFQADGETPDATLSGADEVKKMIDRMIETGPRDSLGNRGVSLLTQIKADLVNLADQASPTYARARATAAPLLEYKKQLQESVIGAIADLKSGRARAAANLLFNQQAPSVIGRARHVISRENPEAWSAIVRAYLWGNFTKASKPSVEGEVINRGAKFAQSVFGTPEQQQVMRAALSPEQFSAFKDLMEVLQATGRVQRAGSRTEFNRLVSEEMKGEAAPIAGTLRQGISPNRWLEAFQEYKSEDYSRAVAEIMTSPDALRRLRQLKRVSPSSRRALQVVGEVLLVGGAKPAQAEYQEAQLKAQE